MYEIRKYTHSDWTIQVAESKDKYEYSTVWKLANSKTICVGKFVYKVDLALFRPNSCQIVNLLGKGNSRRILNVLVLPLKGRALLDRSVGRQTGAFKCRKQKKTIMASYFSLFEIMLGLMGENQCLLPPLILFYTIALFPQTKITNLLSSNSMFADDEKI